MNAERLLTRLLRFVGAVCVLAVFAVFLPRTVMAAVHETAGLGRFPDEPIAAYLARATSALCAFYGGLLLVVSRDVRRYREIIRYQSIAIMLCSISGLAMNLSTGPLLTFLVIDAVLCWAYCVPVLILASRISADAAEIRE